MHHKLTLEQAKETFIRALEGNNRTAATIRAYQGDVTQFINWIHGNNSVATTPADVEKADLTEYLAYLASRDISGVSRARKLAAIREYFRFLEGCDLLAKSPANGLDTPKKEKNSRTFLRPDEYTRMLSLAGGNPRDYAILQVFLQTGIRVSELCNLRMEDIDLPGATLRVTAGKGMVAREIELEKKAIQAIKSYLAIRPSTYNDLIFLNRDGDPISERGVRKLVVKYRRQAGITKKVSCHSLRHTFATYKAEKGVSPFQLQQWLGHANLNTTQIYVHLGRQNAKRVMEATSL
jgi:integrase/recombinase XerC